MDLMLFDQVIAFDHYRQKVLLITGVMTDDLEELLRESSKEIAGNGRSDSKRESRRNLPSAELAIINTAAVSERKILQRWWRKPDIIFSEGDIFQVVLSNPMRAKAEGSLFDTYRVLRASNPSPYMFYFSSDDIELAGASPETLAKLEKQLSTFPLAGTRPRGKTKKKIEAGRRTS